MTDRPFNVYQDVDDEARADWLASRPPRAVRRHPRVWNGNPETAPDNDDEEE